LIVFQISESINKLVPPSFLDDISSVHYSPLYKPTKNNSSKHLQVYEELIMA